MSEDFCARKIQIGENRWTKEDQELEDWLQERGYTYTDCVDYYEDAKSDAEWKRYVADVKEYAHRCGGSVDEFGDLREHVKGLIPKGKSHDVRDKNGKLICIID